MGRYYSGDIEGKFWFAVQSSNCADRFGVVGHQPETLDYYFDESDLPSVQSELKVIEDSLSGIMELFDEFFDKNNGYNNENLINFFIGKGVGFPPDKDEKAKVMKKWLSDYADYEIGKKIEKELEENGSCCFNGEY